MKYEKVWCKPIVEVDLDFDKVQNLEILILLLEDNDCSFQGIYTNQCYEVHIYQEDIQTMIIYKSNIGLENIFNTIYIKHCKEEE